MYLEDCKKAIDQGRTAKHLRWRSILHYLIRKEGQYYGLQAQGYVNPDGVEIVKQETSFYPHWDLLIDALGYYADSGQWVITNDPFEPYLPPERKIAP